MEYDTPPSPPVQKAPGFSIASLILGIFSVVGGALLIIPPILAIVFGHVSRSECVRKNISAGKGMALAGLIMGYVSLLGPIPVGLMAAMAIPAFQKVRATSQEKAITNNLRMIASASQQFMLDNGKPNVVHSDIVGPGKYIQSIQTVNGEDYSDITVTIATTEISVKDQDGRVISYTF